MIEGRSVFAGTWGLVGHELQIGIKELSGGLETFNTGSPRCVFSELTTWLKNTCLH